MTVPACKSCGSWYDETSRTVTFSTLCRLRCPARADAVAPYPPAAECALRAQGDK